MSDDTSMLHGGNRYAPAHGEAGGADPMRSDTYAPQPPQYGAPHAAPGPAPGPAYGEPHGGRGGGSGGSILAAVLAAVLAAFIVGAFAGAAAGFFGARVAVERLTGSSPSPGTINVTGDTDEPVSAAAAAAVPAVVNIDVSGGSEGTATGSLPQGHPDVPLQGNGSGVAYKKAPGGGTYIITNNHVVEGADTIIVTPSGGDRVKATLVGADPDTDIAVVKVDQNLPLIKLGDSTKLEVGEVAIAIGSPFGLEHSVTAGVVSALHRSLPPTAIDTTGTASLVDVIQTDAAINPGNSGGALVDRQGKLIGINSAIFSSSGTNDGVGFAIPVSSAAKLADELIGSGKVRHAFLGIVGQTVTENIAAQKKLPVTEGAIVVEVMKGTGAEKAGLKPNDVVVRLDGTRIRSMEDLIGAVRSAGVGKTVTLRVYRRGEQITLRMTVGVKPSNL